MGLVVMSAKPFHRQHADLIWHAADECDEVRLFVSLADRARPGEFVVRGVAMQRVWQELVEPRLPSNVVIEYTSSPVKAVWATLGAAKDARSQDTFMIYGDPQDLAARFNDAALAKYVGPLHARGQVLRRTMPVLGPEVRGTSVRQHMAAGDFESFKASMPSWLDAARAWSILVDQVDESLLRAFVRHSMRARA